jgi:hypothetical protein
MKISSLTLSEREVSYLCKRIGKISFILTFWFPNRAWLILLLNWMLMSSSQYFQAAIYNNSASSEESVPLLTPTFYHILLSEMGLC